MQHLTKTRYVNGLACDRRLWLERHKPDLAVPHDEATLRLFRQGNEVDEAARVHVGGGVLMPAAHKDAAAAVEATRQAIDRGEARIFQAAFVHEAVLVVVDILEQDADGWHLVEVKMAASVKPEHLEDVAVQRYVVEGSGLRVSRASLMHINTRCVAPRLSDLFIIEDVTARLGEAADVSTTLARFASVLAEPTEPDVTIGRHCVSPRECPFKAHCWSGFEGRTIYDLQDLHHTTQRKLSDQGVLLIDDIPDTSSLPVKAQAGLARWREKRVDVDEGGLRERLAELQYPVAFLDFETDNPPVPVHPGARPYQQVPFQYSLHILHDDGRLEHREYLHTEASDPRDAFVEALLADLPEEGSVVVYNAAFERRVLKELAEFTPDHAAELEQVMSRLWDQLEVISKAYRHHAFGASNSIKAVLPVLVPGLSYDGLNVANGSQAQVAFERIVRREGDWEATESALRDYCRLDTRAMVELHRHFTLVLAHLESENGAAE